MTFLRRACLLVALVAALWVPIALSTGGIRFRVAGIRISARSVTNPLVVAAVGIAAAWALAPAGAKRRTLAADLRVVLGVRMLAAAAPAARRLALWTPSLIGGAAAVAVIAAGVIHGAFVGGGSDSYGYVSQAHLWATSPKPVAEPMMRAFHNERYDPLTFVPLGWAPAVSGDSIVPTYAPGLPMVMGVVERIAGADAIFYVVPLLAGLTVVSTYVLGRALGGRDVGAAAAVLVASSPVLLAHATSPPMSDVPAAAWWTLMLALLTIDRTSASFGAGVAASLAILTRPNLVPLALPAAALLLWPAVQQRRLDSMTRARLTAFAAGAIPGCLAVAAINTYWYGSPTESGYGSLDTLFGWNNWHLNLSRWAGWLAETQTPLIAIAAAGPFLVRPHVHMSHRGYGPVALAAAAATYVLVLIGCYLFYMPFDAWWFLRFLLPGVPVLMAFFAMALFAAARRLPSRLAAHAVMMTVVALLAWNGVREAIRHDVFIAGTEYKYADVGRYAGRYLPADAALLAMQHSGSARLYSGRPTLRWDKVKPWEIDRLVDGLRARGYEPYFVLEHWEVDQVKAQFRGARAIAGLDGPPIAQILAGLVRIYGTERRDPAAVPATIPNTFTP